MRLLYFVAALVFVCTSSASAAPASPSPAPAASPAGSDGLKIDDCSLEYNDLSGMPAKLHIDFENLTALPVTHIRFRIRAGRTQFAVMDLGSFRPKLRIHHDLDPPEQRIKVIPAITGGGVSGLTCSVDAYTLTDGYTWVSPELQLDLQHPQTQQQHPQR